MRKKKNKMMYYYIISIVILLIVLIWLLCIPNTSKTVVDTNITKINFLLYNEQVKTGYIDGAICNKKTEYNTIVSSQEDANQKLICTINSSSPYLFSWQIYIPGMETKVVDWLQTKGCVNNFLNWDIQEDNRCGRERQKDKIAIDEGQADVYLRCTEIYDDNVNYHYIWKRYIPK